MPSGNFCAGEKKALANDVVVDGVTGFLLEFPHHVILAQVVFPRKGFNGKIFSKVVVNITEKLFYLGITAVERACRKCTAFPEKCGLHKP